MDDKVKRYNPMESIPGLEEKAGKLIASKNFK
jgi:hypothetical protein